MRGRGLDLWRGVARRYRALMGQVFGRVAAASVVAIVFAVVGPSTAWALPDGTVGGIQSPASLGALELAVLASESEGVGLHSATALIDGQVKATTLFEDGACRTGTAPEIACPAVVTLNVVTLDLSDGEHQLDVVIEDALARQAIKRHRFEVDNTPPVSTPTVTVDVASGSILPSPPSGSGPIGPDADGPSCASPHLSMFLAQNPLRFRRGVPVLAENRRYRFQGHLTCRVNGRRRAAPRGTEVQVLHRTPRRLMVKSSLAVRGGGQIAARLAFQSRRVVIFRVRGEGGRFVHVRIPIRTAAVRRGRS
jgi:hypothetical protein